MYCRKCGAEQREVNNFCSKCGTPFFKENNSDSIEPYLTPNQNDSIISKEDNSAINKALFPKNNCNYKLGNGDVQKRKYLYYLFMGIAVIVIIYFGTNNLDSEMSATEYSSYSNDYSSNSVQSNERDTELDNYVGRWMAYIDFNVPLMRVTIEDDYSGTIEVFNSYGNVQLTITFYECYIQNGYIFFNSNETSSTPRLKAECGNLYGDDGKNLIKMR